MASALEWTEVDGRAFAFEFISGYQGVFDYWVVEKGSDHISMRISDHRSAPTWRPGDWTASKDDYNRDTVGAVGLLTRGLEPVDASMLEAFNIWTHQKMESDLATMRAKPEVYGSIDLSGFEAKTTPRKRGRWSREHGWQIVN